MPRTLSKAEQAYITDKHETMSMEDICADMDGVGVKTIKKFIETSVMPESVRGESTEERQEKLEKRTGLTAGKLMARDPERGITAMTPGASELADVSRKQNTPTKKQSARSQESRIHIIDKSKKVY